MESLLDIPLNVPRAAAVTTPCASSVSDLSSAAMRWEWGGMLPGWAITVSEPRAEAKAVANVINLGFNVFYPKIIRRIHNHGKRTQILCPLFPGYFFTWLEAKWTHLFKANGLAGLLMEGEGVATIDGQTMQALKDRCNTNGIYLDPTNAQLQRGQKVRITSGPFTDKVGVFEGISGKQSAVLMDLLGGPTRVLLTEGTFVAA